MAMETLWRYMPFIALPIIFFLGLLALFRLPDRIARGFLGSALLFVFMAIFVCVFGWLRARLRGEAFLDSWLALVIVMGVMLMSFVTALLWPEPSLKAKVLVLRSIGALEGALGIAILILDGWEISLTAVALIGVAAVFGLILPRRLIKEAREKERFEAQREGEAERDSEERQEQERAEDE